MRGVEIAYAKLRKIGNDRSRIGETEIPVELDPVGSNGYARILKKSVSMFFPHLPSRDHTGIEIERFPELKEIPYPPRCVRVLFSGPSRHIVIDRTRHGVIDVLDHPEIHLDGEEPD